MTHAAGDRVEHVNEIGLENVVRRSETQATSRPLLTLLVVLVPVLLFGNVYASFRHSELVREVERLEREQAALIEANKEAILAISVLRSPQRIGELAVEELGLERVSPEQIEHLNLGGAE